MSEKIMARTFCQLAAKLHPIRVENLLLTPGLPDCNLSTGAWCEFKWAREWPKRGGPLRLPHFTPEQKNWARKRMAAGGECFLVLQVRSEWFIFDGDAYFDVGEMTREEMMVAARFYFPVKPTSDELCACFT